jgi:hypothetical protein
MVKSECLPSQYQRLPLQLCAPLRRRTAALVVVESLSMDPALCFGAQTEARDTSSVATRCSGMSTG